MINSEIQTPLAGLNPPVADVGLNPEGCGLPPTGLGLTPEACGLLAPE